MWAKGVGIDSLQEVKKRQNIALPQTSGADGSWRLTDTYPHEIWV